MLLQKKIGHARRKEERRKQTMKKRVLLIGIVSVTLFLGGCDTGKYAPVPDDAKVCVYVERQVLGANNADLRVWAKNFQRSVAVDFSDTLVFDCPCYIGNWLSQGMAVAVRGAKLEVELLPGAPYTVNVEFLE